MSETSPNIDPTANVIALTKAEGRRQDDLRAANEYLSQARYDHLLEIGGLRSTYDRLIADAETRRVNEMATLRADFSDKLAVAEKQRIDAIRAVDVNAVAVASQRAVDQASVLANQVAASAEALRTLVASTASTVAVSLQQLSTTLSTRLTTLEQAGYQAAGKSSYSDPAFAELLAEVKQLRDSNRSLGGRTVGISQSWGVFLGAAGLLISVVVGFVAFNRGAPQIVYPPMPGLAAPVSPGPAR